MPSWNEYEIRLVFQNYFIQGVGYGETKEQALRVWEANLEVDYPEPLETEIIKTGEIAD